MNTPFFANPAHFATLRRLCIKLNRILAWSMLATPFTLVMHKVSFSVWLDVQFALLLAHGALSLMLFGLPKMKGQPYPISMYLSGFAQQALTPRNQFLFNGFRIALGVAAYSLFKPWVWSVLVLFMIYPLLRLPISSLQHLYDAIAYALQRWRIRHVNSKQVLTAYFWLLLLISSL